LQSTGKIIQVGNITGGKFGLIRYNTNGSVDSSFGINGRVSTINVQAGGTGDFKYTSVAILDDDKIILGGQESDSGSQVVVWKFNADGSTDNTFGTNGMVKTFPGSAPQAYYNFTRSLKVQTDGKIIIMTLLHLLRYNSNGTLDNTFNGNGILSYDTGLQMASGFVIQPDGKYVVGGIPDTTGYTVGLVRYLTDGSLDVSFGAGGHVYANAGAISMPSNAALDIQPDGKILMCGTKNNSKYAIIRFTTDIHLGTVDLNMPDNTMLIYPNPISEEAFVEFTLNSEAKISLLLFDLQGKLIQSFFSEQQKPVGWYKEAVQFNCSIPSGTYILSLHYGNKSKSMKTIKE